MNVVRLAIVFLIGFCSISGNAADLRLKDMDCAEILERWAENPSSVSKALVDACKDQLAAAPAAEEAVAAAPLAAPVDPCVGPGASASVLCWGPWATLAPAADTPVVALDVPEYPEACEAGADFSDQCVAKLEPLAAPAPEPPLEGCTAGASCGFATLVDGFTSTGDVEDTSFRKFDLDPEGTGFTVDPRGADEIPSATMNTSITERTDGYENLYAERIDGTDEAYIEARIVRDEEGGTIRLAADIWTRASSTNSTLNKSGYFAWGTATSQSGLSLLNGNGVSVAFAGPMSVNNATNAAMTVNFGSQPSWTGKWTNPSWSFGAGGSVSGANLLSNPAQFSSNVQPGGVVQGALLGEPGSQGIAHIIDVTLADKGRIKDVGLLREVTGGGPGIGTGVSP